MRPGIPWRLFLTCCIVYGVHFAPNVVRETYLAVTLAEKLSVRVDPYLGLHPDLFELEGRGAYINNNPGASMLGAIPYTFARPALHVLFRLRPDLVQPKPAATYDDQRPNRTRFMNEARARGLDVKLALAAASMHLGLMVPLGGLAAVVVFLFLRARLRDERTALWLALLYAFGTPIFFRTGYLSQNALLAHCVLFAYVLLAGKEEGSEPEPIRAGLAGGLLGLGVLCDYSGVPLLLAFGVWVLLASPADRLRRTIIFASGAAVPITVLLLYQWIAFGNPFLPAQTYMPPTQFSVGWHGLQLPAAHLLLGNLFDPRYGLFVFSPVLILGLVAPWLRERWGGPFRRELALILGATGALYLFNSSVQFATLQWNTGVRYMVPAVPLLFFAAVPVLLRLPTFWRYALIIPSVAISWSVAMVRESVPTSLAEVFLGGFQLPWLITLRKTAGAYAPFLEGGSSPVALFVACGIIIWLIWRTDQARRPIG